MPGVHSSAFHLSDKMLDNESGDQLGSFGEITLDKKSHAAVPLIRPPSFGSLCHGTENYLYVASVGNTSD